MKGAKLEQSKKDITERAKEMSDVSLATLLQNAIGRSTLPGAAAIIESVQAEQRRRIAGKKSLLRPARPAASQASCLNYSDAFCPAIGEVYMRSQLHRTFGGQPQSGISTPSRYPFIFIFMGSSGLQHGYEDGWNGDKLSYYGEGQTGDMVWKRGNLAIRDHLTNGKDLFLFEMLAASPGSVTFVGSFTSNNWEYMMSPDRTGKLRRSIVFHLMPRR